MFAKTPVISVIATILSLSATIAFATPSEDAFHGILARDLSNDYLLELYARSLMSRGVKDKAKDVAVELATHIPDLVMTGDAALKAKKEAELANARPKHIQPAAKIPKKKQPKSGGGGAKKVEKLSNTPHHEKPSVTEEVKKTLESKKPFGNKKKRDLEDAFITYLATRALEMEDLD